MNDTSHDERRHDELQELLAGYALRSLTGEDAEKAERTLAEHVPGCRACRDTLLGFAELTGDLALTADPLEPPELVWARLHREIASDPPTAVTAPRERRGRFGSGAMIAAAGLVALVVVSGVAISMGTRATRAEDLRGRLANVLETVRAGGQLHPLEGSDTTSDGDLVEVTAPDLRQMSLYGPDVPPPAAGNVYRVWLGSSATQDWDFAQEFVPDESGWVVVTLTIDPSRYDRIAVCEESEAVEPTTPGDEVRWAADLEG
ncbi:MAG: anti-sigma factor [Actinomycetota bacterium]